MIVTARCKKCGAKIDLSIGNMSREEVEKKLGEQEMFHCPGHHMEIGSPLFYWVIDWDSLREGKAPSEKEFVEELKKKYKIVLSSDEMDTSIITGFLHGVPITNDGHRWNFTHSPSGKRYYYRED